MYVPGPSVHFAGPSPLESRNGTDNGRPTDLYSPSLFHKVGSPWSFLCQLRASKIGFVVEVFSSTREPHHICQLRKRLVVAWNRQGPGHESSLVGICWLFVLPKTCASFQKDLRNGNPTKVPAHFRSFECLSFCNFWLLLYGKLGANREIW